MIDAITPLIEEEDNHLNQLPPKEALEHMREIWEELLGKQKGSPVINHETAVVARGVFKTHFKGDISRYRAYLNILATSPYLMKPEFSLHFKWAIRGYTIDAIYRGEYCVKLIPGDTPVAIQMEETKEKADKMAERIEASSENPVQKHIRKKILERVGVASYISWFERETVVLKDGRWKMETKSTFVQSKWDANHAWDELRREGLI